MPALLETPRRPNDLENKKSMLASLSLHERVLARAMLEHRSDATVRYHYDSDGMRRINALTEDQSNSAVWEFAHHPVDAIAYMRNNVMTVAQEKLSPLERKQRFRRYLDAYLSAQVKFDHAVSKPDDEVYKGIPDYIPDGLSDMGSEEDPNPKNRDREKIRINKEAIFRQARPLFEEILSTNINDWPPEAFKIWVIKRVAHFVYTNMPYDYDDNGRFIKGRGRSIALIDFESDRLAKCRHHALYTQVLLQAFGINSRLLKCDVDFDNMKDVPHAANLARVQGEWYLLDSTNPDVKNGVGEIFMRPIPQRNIDLNRQNYTWRLQRNNGTTWEYRSRNNMHYRMRDNRDLSPVT